MKNKILFIIFFSLFLSSCSKQTMYNLRQDGITLVEEEKYEEAIKKLNDSLILGDGDITDFQLDILLYKAECEYRLAHYDKAKELYKVLLTIDKNNKEYEKLYNASLTYEKLLNAKKALDNNNIDEAEKLLNDVRNSGLENDKSYLFNEIILMEKRGLYKEALSLINKYLITYPDDNEAIKEKDFIALRTMNIIEPTTQAKEEETTTKTN
ncbi:MAG: tetratricopeptide repeat protein [Eubacteriales bacterium]|nr:tetratricopeptide repeat protein [Eubacteriales bacterium]